MPGDEADIRLKWQEKVFGPQEILAIASSDRNSRRRGGGAAAAARTGSFFRLQVNNLA